MCVCVCVCVIMCTCFGIQYRVKMTTIFTNSATYSHCFPCIHMYMYIIHAPFIHMYEYVLYVHAHLVMYLEEVSGGVVTVLCYMTSFLYCHSVSGFTSHGILVLYIATVEGGKGSVCRGLRRGGRLIHHAHVQVHKYMYMYICS